MKSYSSLVLLLSAFCASAFVPSERDIPATFLAAEKKGLTPLASDKLVTWTISGKEAKSPYKPPAASTKESAPDKLKPLAEKMLVTWTVTPAK